MFYKYYFRYAAMAITGSGVFMMASITLVPKFFEFRNLRKSFNEDKLSEIELRAYSGSLPSRDTLLSDLASKEFDILVIGGGATGCGVALDAVTRGLSTALVEKYDFSSGTSSKSTKLLHGGVRYLQQAISHLDLDHFNMVRESLDERATICHIAPHLAKPLLIMLPLYKYWQVPYYWIGIKLYDLISGSKLLHSSYFVSKWSALKQFPIIKADNLVGAMVYCDGQHNDARLNLSVALTAIRLGGSLCNYVEVESLLHDENGNVCGAKLFDSIKKQNFTVKAKCIINATGAHTDSIRMMDNKDVKRICSPSSGVHITLPQYYGSTTTGMLIPETKDGRLLFLLPWNNYTIAGTTDTACEVTHNPIPTEHEIQFILQELHNCITDEMQVGQNDVMSAWSGIRPLVTDPNKKDTQSLARNHVIEVAPSKLITIAGGKWTTYRKMAEETVDKAVTVCRFLSKASNCMTRNVRIEGSHTWSPKNYPKYSKQSGMDLTVVKHLCETYGDRVVDVFRLARSTSKNCLRNGIRLHADHPYLEAEVRYACRCEYAQRAVDLLARRTRLLFLDVHAAVEVLPRVVDLMAEELNWDGMRKREELHNAVETMRYYGFSNMADGHFDSLKSLLDDGNGKVNSSEPVHSQRCDVHKFS